MYSSRKWLNDNTVAATGSIVTFYGPSAYEDMRIEPMLEIADCHSKIRLHMSKTDGLKDYIRKIRILAEEADNFADYLETQLGTA